MLKKDEETDHTPTKLITVHNVAGNVNITDAPEYEISSAINELLNCLARTPSEFQTLKRRPPPEVIVKIQHNNLKSKSNIIKQYMDHSSKIEEAYKEIDSMITFGKNTILENLNHLYYSALDELNIEYLLTEVDINLIRENSNHIIEYIIGKLKSTAFESKNKPKYREYIELGINVVVAHAFIECIILESPNIDS